MAQADHTHEELEEIAVIGMSAQFPGAFDIDSFWKNLKAGHCAITSFTDEELSEVDEALRNDPKYVRSGAVMAGGDQFDAAFFDMSPREANATDPQQRKFLECCWNLLEHAGYNPETHGRRIGVFAGNGAPAYFNRLIGNAALVRDLGHLQLVIGNTSDHLAPRVSYLMNLGGPSVPVQTACSTSLVAVHLACQSLISFESDMCIAGGSSILVPLKTGYLFQEGSILSPDGLCRPFDADAAGTVRGTGVGAVLLKRLEDAMVDGDHIHAVIKASAINNDGSAKVGYTAPSVEGQSRVIREALAMGDIDPADVTMIEGHGTGTTLGDPIEFEALSRAFETEGKGFCALGSVKANIGHLDAAAGIAGFIKAVLCVEHGELVPTPHYKQANPKIDFESSPFFVNTENKPWNAEHRMAGISSFGIGGTNAHVIVAQPPEREPSSASDDVKLILVSAHSSAALHERSNLIRAYLNNHPDTNLDDLAYTLAVGRKEMPFRQAIAAGSRDEIFARLGPEHYWGQAMEGKVEVIYLFPGQGTAYQDLGKDLYANHAIFRERVDHCRDILKPHLGLDITEYMFTDAEDKRAKLLQPELWQPALFVSAYASAQVFLSWGIEPAATMGHSIGEYVCAVLAGTLKLEDALALVAKRGQLTAQQPSGSMLAVFLSEERVKVHLSEQLDLAAVNGKGLCVVSGTTEAIDALSASLTEDGIRNKKIETTHAFHSAMMEPLMEPLTKLVESFELQAPELPFISNVSGTWMSAEDATDPGYWARHLRGAVRFEQGIRTLCERGNRIFVEVGPGKVLAKLAQTHPDRDPKQIAVLGAEEGVWNRHEVVNLLGQLWRNGAKIDWQAYYQDQDRHRLALPGYPFRKDRFWVEPGKAGAVSEDALGVRLNSRDWFYLPTWEAAPFTHRVNLKKLMAEPHRWLVFIEPDGIGERFAALLESNGQKVDRAEMSNTWDASEDGRYTFNPAAPSDISALFNTLAEREHAPEYIIFTCEREAGRHHANPAARLLRLAQALFATGKGARMLMVSSELLPVSPGETGNPEAAGCLGAARVIPKEIPGIYLRTVDLPAPDAVDEALLGRVLDDFLGQDEDWAVAYRGGQRMRQSYVDLPRSEDAVSWPHREGKVLLLNGIQEIGFATAEQLLAHTANTVVLAGRNFFPPENQWDDWIADQGENDTISRYIVRLRAMDRSRVSIAHVDLAKDDGAAAFFEEQGHIHTLLCLDPITEAGTVHMKTLDRPMPVLRDRVAELSALEQHFKGDRLVLSCENEGEVGIGYIEQYASHVATSVFANRMLAKGMPVTCIEWGTRGWEEDPNMDTTDPILKQLMEKRASYGTTQAEYYQTLCRVLALDLNHLIISTRDYAAVIDQVRMFTASYFQEQMANRSDSMVQPRPNLPVEYAAPESETETTLCEQWAYFFGIDKVGIDDDFFELGGHSLLAVQVLNKTNESFGTDINIQQLFETSTIRELAEHIDSTKPQLDDDEMAALLAEIEGLSDDEALAAFDDETDED